jgi:N-acetylglucosamine-6-phosphate deacetylase
MAGLADDRYIAMLIGDGHHLPAGVLRVMLRAKGMEHALIVSDAAPVAGLPPGRYVTLGNEAILEDSGRLHNPTKGVLVGSSATLLQCMNHLASLGFLSLDELLALGFYNPLRLLGLDPTQLPPSEGNLSFDEDFHQFKIS